MKACETVVAMAVIILSFGGAHAQDVSFGARLFHDKADCQFCHGINGDGRGDARSPGTAANLHETRLDREQLIEAIACGRPGTEMPHFDKYAYEDKTCYGALQPISAPTSPTIRTPRRSTGARSKRSLIS